MSTRDLNWLKFGALVTLAFVLGLFVAGLLDFPRTGLAQSGSQARPPLVKVEAPRLPSVKTLSDVSDAFASIVEAVRPSVVFVEVDRPAGPQAQVMGQVIPRLTPQQPQPDGRTELEHSSGSGFIVSSDGYILTNNHVIQGATKVKVHLLNGRSYEARVVGSDEDTDVGVLKIDETGLTPAALGESDDVRVGEWVMAIGNPLGSGLTFSVTSGIVSAKGRGTAALGGIDPNAGDRTIMDFIQTDAVVNRGNSGGPLINVRGEVIGINAAIASYTGYYQGYAFAVPIDLARNVMQQIIEHGKVERAGLGVLVRDANAEDAAYVGLDSIGGIRIDDFPPGAETPAQKAGMQIGDVITAIDGRPVKYVAQLQQVVGFRRPGETVRVEVRRGDGKHDFTVRLMSVSGESAETPAANDAADTKPSHDTGKNSLGLTVEPLTPALAARNFLPQGTKGLLIQSIRQGVPAEEKLCPADACNRPADVITEVEGKPVRTEAELRDALNGGRHGVVTLTVVAGDQRDRTATSRIERLRTGNN